MALTKEATKHAKFHLDEIPEVLQFVIDERWLSPRDALVAELEAHGQRLMKESHSGTPNALGRWYQSLAKRVREDKMLAPQKVSPSLVRKVADSHCYDKKQMVTKSVGPANISRVVYETGIYVEATHFTIRWEIDYQKMMNVFENSELSFHLFGRLLVALMVGEQRAWELEDKRCWHAFTKALEEFQKSLKKNDPMTAVEQTVEALETEVRRFGLGHERHSYGPRVVLTFMRNQMVA